MIPVLFTFVDIISSVCILFFIYFILVFFAPSSISAVSENVKKKLKSIIRETPLGVHVSSVLQSNLCEMLSAEKKKNPDVK
jgi:hypothetical protein